MNALRMPPEAKNGRLVDSKGILEWLQTIRFANPTSQTIRFKKFSAAATPTSPIELVQNQTNSGAIGVKNAEKKIKNIFEVEKNIFEVEKTTSKSVRNLFEVVQPVAAMTISCCGEHSKQANGRCHSISPEVYSSRHFGQ